MSAEKFRKSLKIQTRFLDKIQDCEEVRVAGILNTIHLLSAIAAFLIMTTSIVANLDIHRSAKLSLITCVLMLLMNGTYKPAAFFNRPL